MSQRIEDAGRNAIITFLGGLVEPASEVAQPVPPYASGQNVQTDAVSTQHPAHNSEPVKTYPIESKWLIWGGLGFGLLVVIALIVMIVKE